MPCSGLPGEFATHCGSICGSTSPKMSDLLRSHLPGPGAAAWSTPVFFFQRFPTAAGFTYPSVRYRILAHKLPLSLEDGGAAHSSHTGEARDPTVSLLLRQESQDPPGMFLVETRERPVQLSVLCGFGTSRMLLAHLALANPLGPFGHACC